MGVFDRRREAKRRELRGDGRRLHLPLVVSRRDELETCVSCPRLCRATCPVSNADPREALIPWGKMRAVTGPVSVPSSARASASREEIGTVPFACTDCGACTALCRHDNPVGDVLREARVEAVQPRSVRRFLRIYESRARARQETLRALAESRAGQDFSPSAEGPLVLMGCPTLSGERRMLSATARVLERACGTGLRWLEGCCGAVHEQAGERQAADLRLRELTTQFRHGSIVVVDPACRRRIARETRLEPIGLSEALPRSGLERSPGLEGRRFGWHPPCWERGTRAAEASRELLGAVLGDFVELEPGCSGGGALLPFSYPDASRSIASARLAQFVELGVTDVIVGCSTTARRFRSVAAGQHGSTLRIIELSNLLEGATLFDEALFDEALFDEALFDEALFDEALFEEGTRPAKG